MTDKLQEHLVSIIVAAMAVLCAPALLHVVQIVPLHIPLDPNEGWNAYHATAVMKGGALYPHAPSMMVNNYPPLFFYLDGLFGRLLGDNIIAGRILSLVALLAIALEIALAAGLAGALSSESAFAVLFFVAALLLQSDYVGMADPQLIGHAIQLAALLILLKSRRFTSSTALAALLLIAGFFFKHNLIILPAALTLWLALTDRASALKLALFGLSFLIAGLVAFHLIFGVDLLEQLRSARVYSLKLFVKGVGPWLAWNGLSLAAASIILVSVRRDPFALLCAIYLALGVVVGAVFYGGAGVDINAMFDGFIALSLAAGFALARSRGSLRQVALAGAWVLPLAIGLGISFDGNWLMTEYWLDPMKAERVAAGGDIGFLKRQAGPAICEMLSLCYWAGKPAEADVFNLAQQYATGKRSDDDLAALLARKHYSVIQIDPDGSFALTPRIEATFEANYELDHSNDVDGAFYVPR